MKIKKKTKESIRGLYLPTFDKYAINILYNNLIKPYVIKVQLDLHCVLDICSMKMQVN